MALPTIMATALMIIAYMVGVENFYIKKLSKIKVNWSICQILKGIIYCV